MWLYLLENKGEFNKETAAYLLDGNVPFAERIYKKMQEMELISESGEIVGASAYYSEEAQSTPQQGNSQEVTEPSETPQENNPQETETTQDENTQDVAPQDNQPTEEP